MTKYGRYLQVMPGKTLPSTESGSVQSKFGKALSENIRIDVYESPHLWQVGYLTTPDLSLGPHADPG
jgi:hypothetical protein